MLGLECSTVRSKDVDVDRQKIRKKPLKCEYREEWKRS